MTKRSIRTVSAALVLCLCLCAASFTAPAANAEGEIGKVTVRTVKNYDPCVLDSILDHSATESSTGGTYTSQATWYDSNGNVASGVFNEGEYVIEISVYAVEGCSFSPDASGYINNDPAELIFIDSSTVILRRQVGVYSWNYTQVWKNPGDEKVESDDDIASFVVSGVYFNQVTWMLVDKDGSSMNLTQAGNRFPDASFETSRPDENTARLNIRRVPDEMDGWKVYATLSNPTSSANTGKAKIIVANAQPTPTPTTPPPEQSGGDSSGSKAPSESGDGGGESEDNHEHFFSPAWRNNENGHWHECECGEKNELAAHSMSWTTKTPATAKNPGEEHGVCSVCGYSEDREVEFVDESSAASKIFMILIAVIAVIVLILIIEQARYNRRRRQRQSYKDKYR